MHQAPLVSSRFHRQRLLTPLTVSLASISSRFPFTPGLYAVTIDSLISNRGLPRFDLTSLLLMSAL